MKTVSPQPPFLVFPDHSGGFFVFENPVEVFPGSELERAEAGARVQGWLAGGFEYGPAERFGAGWWGVFRDPRDILVAELEEWADAVSPVIGALRSQVSYEDYQKSFALVRAALESGTTYQVNLTMLLSGTVASGRWTWRTALKLWLDLIAAQGREASFVVLGTDAEPGPILVSASPELFFHQEGKVVEARPMKGTSLRQADPSLDAASRHELATSAKTKAENLMVTDMLRNDLGRIAVPGGVSVPRLFEIEEYPTVWQMTSTVRAELPEEPSLASLMSVLFPCASITGAPKISTQGVIGRAERDARGWYTGTLGWHRAASPVGGVSRSRFSVLIRTLVFSGAGPEFRLGVGGGVVWDSTAEGEWDEAWAKARFLRTAQRGFSLLEAILWTTQDGFTLLPEHEARLAKSCRAFGGALPPGTLLAALEAEVARLQSAGFGSLKLRVLVEPDFSLRTEGEPLSTMPEILTVALAERPFGEGTLLWRQHKTTNRRIYDEARIPGADQTLHYNESGELTEATSMNLVLEKDGRFLTPAASSGLLEGTFRARLLAEKKIEEAVLPVEALKTAEKIWLINSIRGWKQARLL